MWPVTPIEANRLASRARELRCPPPPPSTLVAARATRSGSSAVAAAAAASDEAMEATVSPTRRFGASCKDQTKEATAVEVRAERARGEQLPNDDCSQEAVGRGSR